jgi:hypothetical protein
MLPPWNNMVWSELLRGVAFGFVGGFVLILLFLFTYKFANLIPLRPMSLVYFLVGVEIGFALIGAVFLGGLQALANWREHSTNEN